MWDSFWFEPSEPTDLGVSRALFYSVLFVAYFSYDVSGYPTVAPVFWQPVWAFRVLHLPVFSPPVLHLLQIIWKVSLVAAAVGLSTRLSTWTAFVLGFYLIGLPFCYGYASHYAALPIFILLLLALSRCGDAFSLDAYGQWAAAPSGEYTWPLRAVWVLLACVFLLAGVAKLRASGLAWVTSDFFAFTLRRANYPLGRVAPAPLTEWGLWIAQHPWLCRFLAGSSLLCELAYPLTLFSRRLRAPLIFAMFSMLVGVKVVLGPPFETFLLCHLFWVPWSRLLHLGNLGGASRTYPLFTTAVR